MSRLPVLAALAALLAGAPAAPWLAQQDGARVEAPDGGGEPPAASAGPALREFDLDAIIEEALDQPAGTAERGVLLRALDKVSGEVVDFELLPGQTKQLGHIQVTLGECRYPLDNPAGDAAARLVVRNAADGRAAFRGWMLASSPALNALDHPRYDVWVLRCNTS